jgi:hypothetical protein
MKKSLGSTIKKVEVEVIKKIIEGLRNCELRIKKGAVNRPPLSG